MHERPEKMQYLPGNKIKINALGRVPYSDKMYIYIYIYMCKLLDFNTRSKKHIILLEMKIYQNNQNCYYSVNIRMTVECQPADKSHYCDCNCLCISSLVPLTVKATLQ